MRRSVLVYRKENAGKGIANLTVITLHGYGATSDQLLPLAQKLGNEVCILAPEGPQPVVPHLGTVTEGQLWFTTQGAGSPEPTLFGDSLYQVEQFLLDVVEEQNHWENADSPIYLLGFDQGGVLALSLACIWPELLGGVIAIQGYLPEIPGWTLPDMKANGLPALLVHDPEDNEFPEELVLKSKAQLNARGARVTLKYVAGARRLPLSLSKLISGWLFGSGPGSSAGG